MNNQRIIRNYLREAISQPDIKVKLLDTESSQEVHFSV